MSGITRKPKPPLAVPAETRAEIARDIATGESQAVIAKRHGVSRTAVVAIAEEAGVTEAGRQAVRERVAKAHADYNLVKRLDIINMTFAELEKLVPKISAIDLTKASDVQAVITALAILIDKRRLEEGEATSRAEHVSPDSRRNSILAELDKIEKRRQESGKPMIVVPDEAKG